MSKINSVVKDGKLILTMDLTPVESASGKMILCANTGGWANLDCLFNNKTLRANINVGYNNPEFVKPK